MYLLIDLSENDTIHLALFDKEGLVEFECGGRNRELLECIDKFLTENEIKSHDLKGVMTVVGEGSFTNTRISAVVSNVFGYCLKKPMMAIKKNQIGEVQELIDELESVPVGQYVSAKYSAEPNIG
ncbi:MAG: hypothetical protein Q8O88_05485 [bacterium]|nr:hypothetical protein [bacterium]